MNPDQITNPDEALSHLFFHCCFKDGRIMQDEIKNISEKLVAIGLNKELNFKDEVIRYQSYKNTITDETAYLKQLISLIRPTNELALYSYCVELCLSDGLLQAEEDLLLQKIASVLDMETDEEAVCKKIMVQRQVVASEHVF